MRVLVDLVFLSYSRLKIYFVGEGKKAVMAISCAVSKCCCPMQSQITIASTRLRRKKAFFVIRTSREWIPCTSTAWRHEERSITLTKKPISCPSKYNKRWSNLFFVLWLRIDFDTVEWHRDLIYRKQNERETARSVGKTALRQQKTVNCYACIRNPQYNTLQCHSYVFTNLVPIESTCLFALLFCELWGVNHFDPS